MSSKNNCSVQIYVFSQKGGGFSLNNLVIFQTVHSKAIKTYPNVKKNIEKYVFYKININNSQIIMRNISFVHIDLCWYMSNWQH
jgi:hypothetical protein